LGLVRLTIAPNEPAAEAIRSLLQTEGIESMQRKTDFAAGMTDASTSGFGPREILVAERDLELAQALISES
jgi:hypothetical protein